jgi:hypothetical protein
MTLKFSEPRKLQDGRYFVKVTNDADQRVIVQMNNITLVTQFAESDADVTIAVTEDSSRQVREYDEHILVAARDNSTAWFGREIQQRTIDTAYQRSIVQNTMNVIKSRVTSAYNSSREVIDANLLGADAKCDVVLELQGIWFMKKTFGLNWKLVQVRTRKEPVKKFYESYLFSDEAEEEEQANSEDEYS